MLFSEDRDIGEFAIRRYGPEGIQVNDTLYSGTLLLTPERLVARGLPRRFEELGMERLSDWLEGSPEIFLLGTGSRLRFPPPRVVARLEGEGIGCEIMDTAAACRTWNILASERRRAVALLFPIEE